LRSSLTPSPTRKSFTIESLASSNPEDLVEKDEIAILEHSVEDEINRSILGLEGMLEAPGGENEESCSFVLQSLGTLFNGKRYSDSNLTASTPHQFDASRLVFEDDDVIDDDAIVIE